MSFQPFHFPFVSDFWIIALKSIDQFLQWWEKENPSPPKVREEEKAPWRRKEERLLSEQERPWILTPSHVFYVARRRWTSAWWRITSVWPPRLKWSGVHWRLTSHSRLLPMACTSTPRYWIWGEASHDTFCSGCLGTLQGLIVNIGACPTVLGFEALRAAFLSLFWQSGCDRLIINLVDSDHGWHDIVVHVSSPWETTLSKDYGCVSTVWNRGRTLRGALMPKGM